MINDAVQWEGNHFNVCLFVNRTPMMDLLVQVATAHKINPGGHVIQVMNNRSDDYLFYKPSTPIGEAHIFSGPILLFIILSIFDRNI